MVKSSTTQFPEVFLANRELSQDIYRAGRRGKLKKIGPRLYTTLVRQESKSIIQQRRWLIVGLYAPGGIIGYRTGVESVPAKDGTVFLSGPTRRRVDLDGLRIRVLPGVGPIDGDVEFIGGLYRASQARALLEAMKPSRAGTGEVHSLERSAIESYLDRMLNVSGEDALKRLRDHARRIAPDLRAVSEFQEFERIIGALLGSRGGPVTAPYWTARSSDPPYDADRLVLFERLYAVVSQPVPERPDPAPKGVAFRHAGFLDAYFSNYIEGTEFEVDEARAIVFEGKIIDQRQADSHDVLGTFELVGSPDFMHTSVRDVVDGEEFLARLQRAHATIMDGRPEQAPGEFKTHANRAGNSHFVEPEKVRGTLLQALGIVRALESPFARATMLAFILSEVHPFRDGNGRLSRAFMNAELVSAGHSRILVPTVYRDDYLGALRALTRSAAPEPFVRILDDAQRVTGWVDYTDLDRAIAMLQTCHAFDDDDVGTRLRLPADAGV